MAVQFVCCFFVVVVFFLFVFFFRKQDLTCEMSRPVFWEK